MNLYGTTAFGGVFNGGVLYKISNISEGNFSVLHSFGSGSDGNTPFGGVSLCADGNLFGNTEFGGTLAVGTLWKADKNGNLTVVHDFHYADGGEPGATEIWTQGGDGVVLYGTAVVGGNNKGSGVVYSMDVDKQQQKCAP